MYIPGIRCMKDFVGDKGGVDARPYLFQVIDEGFRYFNNELLNYTGRGMRMRKFRIVMLVVVVLISLITTGCMKTWSIDFTDANATGWDSLLAYEDPGVCGKDENGLILSGCTMRALYGFSGDMDFTVKFDLDVDVLNPVEKMRIYLGNGSDPEAQKLEIVFTDIGDETVELYAIFDNATQKHAAVYISGIKHNDINEFMISIRGGIADFTMNGTELFMPFEIVNYSAPFFFPYIFVQQGDTPEGAEKLVIKSIKVRYSGDKGSK